jgi:alpha-glucoside transport system substrate-binding protein
MLKSMRFVSIAGLAAIMLLMAACAPGPAPTPETIVETVEVPGETVVETVEVQGETTVVTATPAPMEPAQDTGTVFIMGAFRGAEEDAFLPVIDAFEEQNPDIDVVYSGSAEFETLINVRVEAGDPPDIAAIPQPGLVQHFAENGDIVPLWPEVTQMVEDNYSPAWMDLASFGGTPYAVFHRVNAKGWVWYNKPAFEGAGYEVPTTWAEMEALEDQIAGDGTTPWCISIESGAATGWVGTDWLENIMLRTQPVEAYDQWIAGELPFSSEEVTNAWNIMDSIWMNPDYVYGGPAYIATTSFNASPAELFASPPNCYLHMQGSFVTNFFPEDVQANLDEDVGVFPLPPIDESLPTTLEVGGDMYVVFTQNDRPEVRKFVEFLTTSASVEPWAVQGGALFPHQDQDTSWYPTALETRMAEAILSAEAARFDASDAMASECNTAFWRGITDYVGGTDIATATAQIDQACGN